MLIHSVDKAGCDSNDNQVVAGYCSVAVAFIFHLRSIPLAGIYKGDVIGQQNTNEILVRKRKGRQNRRPLLLKYLRNPDWCSNWSSFILIRK